jgi:uncharacterized membrane protein/predicted flap endonuclease-1-like 5' DNA nuclease
MANDNDRLVVAYYVNAAAAEAAAEDLKDWDKADDDIKLGAIGIITLNPHNGEVEVREIGQRNTKRGALWGTAIGAGLGILTAGIALIPGMLAGAAIGGGLGTLNHKSLGMTDEDVANLAAHLKHGGAALGVMCDDFEVAATTAKLVEEGGRTESYEVAQETAEAVTEAAEAQRAASKVVDEVASEVGEGAVAVASVTGLAAHEAAKFGDAGVDKASSLLEMGATPEGRKSLAEETGIAEETILLGVKKLDLMRVKGVGVVYAELLHASGVETVPDLGRRNPANLTATMVEVNASEAIAEDLPGEIMVADWVNQAQALPRVIEY